MLRPRSFGGIHTAIALWIAGLLWIEIGEVYHYGIADYMSSAYNVLDFVMLLAYLAYCALITVVNLQVGSSVIFL